MKPWKDISDEKFDSLVKNEVLKGEYGYPNWEKLSSALEAEGLSRPRFTWKKYLAFIGISLLFFSLTFFIISTNIEKDSLQNKEPVGKSNKIENSKSNTEAKPKSDLQNNADIRNSDKNKVKKIASTKAPSFFKRNIKKTPKGISSEEQAINSLNLSPALIPNIEQDQRKPNLPKRRLLNTASSIFDEGNKDPATVNTNQDNSVRSINKTSGSIQTEKNRLSTTQLGLVSNEIKENKDFNLDIQTINGIENAKGFKQNKYTFPLQLASKSPYTINEKSETYKKSLLLHLSYSPDFSAVLRNSFIKMGYNISAQIEYRLSPKWSVITGVIKSQKHYNANTNQMSWPNYWGSKPVELEGMVGNCNVLDIPLNLRFNIKGDSKAQMYLTGGVSSFVLLRERYMYEYTETMDVDGMMTQWEGSSGFLPAGMANFSIGYERYLSPKLSVQVEPFVKAPINDFGFTDVRLLSTGVFFTGKIKLF